MFSLFTELMLKQLFKYNLRRVINAIRTGSIWRYFLLNVPPMSWFTNIIFWIRDKEYYWLNISNREGRVLFLEIDSELTKVQQKIVQDLKSDGISIVNFEDLFKKSDFVKLKKLANKYLQQPEIKKEIKTGILKRKKSSKSFQIRPFGDNFIFDINNKLISLSINQSLLRIVSNYLGVAPRISNIDLWYNRISKDNRTYSQNWHRDPEDKRFVKVFLYFTDVDDNSGPFNYVKGTNVGGKLFNSFRARPFRGEYFNESVVNKFNKNVIIGTGKKGTIIFCDTRGLHRGGFCKNKARYLLNIVYTSNAAKFKPNFKLLKSSISGITNLEKYALGK